MIQFKQGQRVWWNDPFGEKSGVFTIVHDIRQHWTECVERFGERHMWEEGFQFLVENDEGEKREVWLHECESLFEGTYDELSERIESVRVDMQAFIRQKLRENDGKISIVISEEAQEECDCDSDLFPVISALYGKHGDNPNIGITDVYLKGNSIYAGGIDTETGFNETGFAITPDQYYDVAYFIKKALEETARKETKRQFRRNRPDGSFTRGYGEWEEMADPETDSWAFIGQFLSNYERRDDVATSDDLQVVLDKDDPEKDLQWLGTRYPEWDGLNIEELEKVRAQWDYELLQEAKGDLDAAIKSGEIEVREYLIEVQ